MGSRKSANIPPDIYCSTFRHVQYRIIYRSGRKYFALFLVYAVTAATRIIFQSDRIFKWSGAPSMFFTRYSCGTARYLSNGLESTSPFVVLFRKLLLLITAMDTLAVDTRDAILYAWDGHLGAFRFGRLCKGANGRPSHVAWNSRSSRGRGYVPLTISTRILHIHIFAFYRIQSVQITWLGLSLQWRRQCASNGWRIE